jgi:hypothetical protein
MPQRPIAARPQRPNANSQQPLRYKAKTHNALKRQLLSAQILKRYNAQTLTIELPTAPTNNASMLQHTNAPALKSINAKRPSSPSVPTPKRPNA